MAARFSTHELDRALTRKWRERERDRRATLAHLLDLLVLDDARAARRPLASDVETFLRSVEVTE